MAENAIVADAIDDYKKKHYIPKNIDLAFINFSGVYGKKRGTAY